MCEATVGSPAQRTAPRGRCSQHRGAEVTRQTPGKKRASSPFRDARQMPEDEKPISRSCAHCTTPNCFRLRLASRRCFVAICRASMPPPSSSVTHVTPFRYFGAVYRLTDSKGVSRRLHNEQFRNRGLLGRPSRRWASLAGRSLSTWGLMWQKRGGSAGRCSGNCKRGTSSPIQTTR
jgi:hypothetical protein